MIPQRFSSSQSNIVKKSRIGDGRPSMLPKPRRPGSTDRLSTETRRPSTTGHRSSSAEPSRGTVGGGRDASASKQSMNARSRSQQGDRYGQTPLRSSQYSSRPTTTPQRSRSQQGDRYSHYSVTPLRTSQYSLRPTTTPQRTPSDDHKSRNWQTSLDRVLAFVTIKDSRPISNVAWQRAELARVQEALTVRNGPNNNNMALVRPLTIARFVGITGELLAAVTKDNKLNTDNYVAKLPHLSKRLLYPGAVSKSWLKTVNTLHAFPHALALVAYLLDLANLVEAPVDERLLYVETDEMACIRRDYLNNCWARYQDPEYQFEDETEGYLQRLEGLFGNVEEKIEELELKIKKYETCLNNEVEQAAVAEETRLLDRREALLAALRAERAERSRGHADLQRRASVQRDLLQAIRELDLETDKANAENQQLKLELETQSMSVSERTRLGDEVDYALRVQDCKRVLADQIAKMVLSKETELALWQKKTLDSCVEYKQGLIHLSAQFPQLASLAIDEKELMGAECHSAVSGALEALRACGAALQDSRHTHARNKTALARKRTHLLDETRTKLTEMKSAIKREQQSLEMEVSNESSEAGQWSLELQDIRDKMEALAIEQRNYTIVGQDLDFWEKQDQAWRTKLSSLREYIASSRAESARLFEVAAARRSDLLSAAVNDLQTHLQTYLLHSQTSRNVILE